MGSGGRPVPPEPAARLVELRAAIAAADEELLRLVARRLDLSREIGAAKRAAGQPVRSFVTETEVLERFRVGAAALGLDADLAGRLARQLIRATVRLQEEALPVAPGAAQRVLVVGGAGKMGRWLGRYFLGRGHRVSSYDPAGEPSGIMPVPDLLAGVAAADVILVATPLSPGAEVLERILDARPAGLVADVFSLKSHVIESLKAGAARGLRVASLHPLFGPDVTTLAGRVIAVLDCGNARAADEAAALFADTALTITRLPVEAHDPCMQYVLGLSHLVSILFFTTLVRGGRTYDELAALASTTFYKQARTAAEVARESPLLYHEIQRLNRHSPRLFQLVRGCLDAIEAAALDGRPDAFAELLARGRAYFPPSVPVELG